MRKLSAEELFRQADAVSLHAPATEATTRFVSAARLATMQPHAVLVNSARGALVDFGAAQHTNRMNGTLDYLKANFPEIQIVGPFENQDKAEVAYSLVQDMYTANPDLSLVYVTAGGPFGAAKAIQDLGLNGKVGVVGFDHTPENVAYLKTGEAYAFIDQAPFQQALDGAVRLYNHIVTGEASAEKVIAVDGNILTPDNVSK
jgi:ribose transport system substrate-binding protein